MLTNREIALLLWLGALLLWAASKPKCRDSLRAVLAAATVRQILIPFGAFTLWVLAEAWLATRVLDWSASLTKGVVVWFITAGIVLFGRFNEVSTEAGFFRKKALGLFAWTAFIEFYLDLFHMPLVAELVLQPLLVLLTAISVLAARKQESRRVASLAEGMLALVALGLLAYVITKTVQGWSDLDAKELLLQFALPAWLTLGALPFIFLLALYAGYQGVYARTSLVEEATWWMRVRGMLALGIGLNLRVKEIGGLTGYWLRKVCRTGSVREALQAVKDYRADTEERRRSEEEQKERLVRFAGVAGTDEEGRQLDRREFDATTDALRWLGTCMMGWYGKRDRYPEDLFERIADGFDRFELDPVGIEVRVSEDGQSWYAWRRTVGGWCFALGAAAPPPNQWEYDGADPPQGFPGVDPAWGEGPFGVGDVNTNW